MKTRALVVCGMLLPLLSLAWVNCEVELYSFSLPRDSETSLMSKFVDLVKARSGKIHRRFLEMADDAAAREMCVRLGVSNDFTRVEGDARAVTAALKNLIVDLRALELRLAEVEMLCERERDRKAEAAVISRMKGIVIPRLALEPGATITDAIEFFRKQCSGDAPGGGFSFILRDMAAGGELEEEGSSKPEDDDAANHVPVSRRVIPKLVFTNISFYDALNQICTVVGCQWEVAGGCIVISDRPQVDG